jgi:hypothetical protein
VRLPRADELNQEAIAVPLVRQLPASVTSAWTRHPARQHQEAQETLWLRPGLAHPHELAGTAIRRAVAADARNTAIVPQAVTAAVLDVMLSVIRDLDDVRALSGALAADLTARANSEGEVVELMHAHAHSIVLTYGHALDLTRAAAVTVTGGADQELIGAMDLTPARALAGAVRGELADAIARARASAVELADAIDLDLQILSAFDFDLARVYELARAHASSLDHAYALARGIPRDADLDLAGVFGMPSVHPLDPGLPLPGLLGLPLRWVADGPLAGTALQVLAAGPPPGDPRQAFADALSSRAGIEEATRLRAWLGRPLTDPLRSLAAGAAGDWNRSLGLGRLTDACAPLSGTHRPPGPAEAAALRAVALALTALTDGATAQGAGAADVLRAVAATVTLVEDRAKGEAAAGESIILAVV